ncbi:MAG: bis(5'-nucleosyl)-tetraphosphatase (symmetrical) YqeK [Anaerovoracaceae bacterium]|nr:bis(5'-nucleosyl)-tetraphosphatase (symmetrical) YqeK [Anaerovoracaceae bacterium]
MDCTEAQYKKSDARLYYKELKNQIIEYIEKNLNEKRLRHTYSVAKEAVKLAERYGADAERAELAALFHDMFRSTPVQVLNMYIRQLGLPESNMDNPNLSHGKIAAAVMKKDYGIEDKELLNAVSYHTTGRAGMTLLEKIIFLADAIEPGRKYPDVEKIRETAYVDIDRACIESLERTVKYVREIGEYLDPDTEKAIDYLKEKQD